MKKKGIGGINIGTSLILAIFVLLALVTFAALSYLSAKSDYTLSKEAADRTAKYYDANRMAEIYMANIEGLLTRFCETANNEDEYLQGIDRVFAENERITVRREEGLIYLEYTVAITEGQNLEVSLRANYPSDDNRKLFYIEKWSTCVNNEWLDDVKDGDSKNSGVKLLF